VGRRSAKKTTGGQKTSAAGKSKSDAALSKKYRTMAKELVWGGGGNCRGLEYGDWSSAKVGN